MMLRDCFLRAGQSRALAAYADFARARHWSVVEIVGMCEAARRSFDPMVPVAQAFDTFDTKIFQELKAHWLVFRNSSGPCWTSRQIFGALTKEFAEFAWEGSITLPNLLSSGKTESLLSCLATMRDLKPNIGYPVMAVSKFLHFYNPRIFPIYDYDVVWKQVFGRFKQEFKQFCWTAKLPYDVEDTALFYRNYVCWASSLMTGAHAQFMLDFADWLDRQPGVKKPLEIDASTLYATAFEFTAIGASQQPFASTVSAGR